MSEETQGQPAEPKHISVERTLQIQVGETADLSPDGKTLAVIAQASWHGDCAPVDPEGNPLSPNLITGACAELRWQSLACAFDQIMKAQQVLLETKRSVLELRGCIPRQQNVDLNGGLKRL